MNLIVRVVCMCVYGCVGGVVCSFVGRELNLLERKSSMALSPGLAKWPTGAVCRPSTREI